MKLYDEFKDKRDKFEIVAIHDHRAKTLDEMDKHLKDKKIIEKWGRELPFVVLLDAENATCTNFGIQFFPTTVLIDPEGKLVRGGKAELAAILAQK